jgi:beta-1,4-mannosyl-glycoprotein beta-1,4-N-acetylglucosaminyltransferase
MKIYDCFLYWDEDLLLDLRLNILDNHIDYFVIVEGNKTWQNNSKKFRFDINKFKKFKNKIIYIKVEDMPGGENPWERENFQRNCIERGLVESKDDDLIIISDLDEIPNPKKLSEFTKKQKFAVFRQNHYYYKLNLRAQINPFWDGSRICIKKYLKSPQWLRDLKFKKRPFWRLDKLKQNNIIYDGGWHFCNLKSPKDLVYKYKNLCETNDKFAFNQKISQELLDEKIIDNKISSGSDILNRNEKFRFTKLDDSFPEYLLKNKKKYLNWIAKF